MSRIFWDTNLFVYLIEENPLFLDKVRLMHKKMIERKDELVTSAMTLGEIQVLPLRAGDRDTAAHYRRSVYALSRVVPFDTTAADVFAELRIDRKVTAADAIQLGCAASAGVTIFITNDGDLTKLKIPGIDFITTMDRLPF